MKIAIKYLFAISVLLLISSTSNAKQNSFGNWIVHTTIDPINDKIKSTAILPGEEGSISFYCNGGGEDNMIFSFINRAPVINGSFSTGYYRIDSNPAKSFGWFYENGSYLMGEDNEIDNIVRDLVSANRFIIRASTGRGQFKTVTFDNPSYGARAAFTRLYETCNDTAPF